MDKSSANYVGLENINFLLVLAGIISFVEIIQIKYMNNLVEQNHRSIKKITKPMMRLKAFHSAKAIIDGIETAHMIGKEDLAFILQEKPHCYNLIGNSSFENSCLLHNPHYNFNDKILPIGAAYWAKLLDNVLRSSI